MGKEDTAASTATKKGLSKILECAAFPNGLPSMLEASVALPEASGSESDRSDNCACVTGQLSVEDLCPCATPRKSAPRKPKIEPDLLPLTLSNSISEPTHILSRVAELRPVLPKMLSGPVHVPSSGVNHTRPHISESFSPYGRAYDRVHTAYRPPSLEPPSNQIEPSTSFDSSTYWSPSQTTSPICGCGDSCGCPGCRQHDPNAPTTASGYTCSNPSACGGCLECFVQTLPTVQAVEQDPLDDWMRHQFDIQYTSSPSCSHGCPPGLCQCSSGCNSGCTSSPEKDCCKGPVYTPVDTTSGFFDLPETLPRSRSASSSSSGSASGIMSPVYAGSNYSFAGSSTELGMFSGSSPELSLYAPSNPDVDASYARSNPDPDAQVYNDMEMFSEAGFTGF